MFASDTPPLDSVAPLLACPIPQVRCAVPEEDLVYECGPNVCLYYAECVAGSVWNIEDDCVVYQNTLLPPAPEFDFVLGDDGFRCRARQ